MVALTFDDGPNPGSTLTVARILDDSGVKGAFFTVGKALDARPDISRTLLADGHLLGDHSYHHDYTGWLDPGYPELRRTQAAFRRRLRVCPAFFRPPHGQHTPFMAHAVEARHMTMVTWDVSAGDWATSDAQLVARRVLTRVRNGSIIDLHDGLDGRVGVNRSVLVRALPLILDGLRRKGLEVVRLDRLLRLSGYGATC
jgi:chitin deacetylase